MFFKRNLIRLAAIILIPLITFSTFVCSAFAIDEKSTSVKNDTVDLGLDCKSAILVEASTGTVLYEQNADEALPPASVTKIMTLLLVMEAIEDGRIHLDDIVTTSANAASMGGSQIYLKEGEQMSVEDMIKSVVIASANDAACALAEHVCGSEETFVKRMNERAAELGMDNTCFENTNGLDDTAIKHLTSARDIATMSRELIKYKTILEYSSIWMDTVRNGLFGLTNTNRLVRFYRGCTGLKTGSTSKAGFCVSATAERDGMTLIAVIMGAESGDARNSMAASLLDWGFAEYTLYTYEPQRISIIKVNGGVRDSIECKAEKFSCVIEKKDLSKIKYSIDMPKTVSAPIKNGDVIGKIVFTCDNEEIGTSSILSVDSVDEITFLELWYRMLAKFILK